MSDPDVVVLGAGPSGRAAAFRAAAAGATVAVVDPHPRRRWRNTYGMWADELPSWLDRDVRAAEVAAPDVHAIAGHVVARPYVVLDTGRLQDFLTVDTVRDVHASATNVDGHRVSLSDGSRIRADTVVDARGSAVGAGIPEQTAYGLVFSRDAAAPALGAAEAYIMDWRRDNGARANETPSFLYAVPLDDDRVLLEETCLVGRPGLSFDVLADRLRHRLAVRGVSVSGDEDVERVRFAMRPPPRAHRRVEVTGARSSAMHPATGYSVAASLRRADVITARITGAGNRRDRLRRTAALESVAALRSVGGDALLTMPSEKLVHFFDDFFSLPIERQRAYLSADEDVRATSGAMLDLFGRIDNGIRTVILRAVRDSATAAVGGRIRRR